jgi:uncharacterized protein
MMKKERSKRPSNLRFNFGFLIVARPGTSREIFIDYPSITLEDDLIITPLTGTFEAIRNSKGIYITGELQTKIAAECARCLIDLLVPVTLQLEDLFYYPAHIAHPGEYGVGEDGFIDLAPLVRELILLESPMQPLCKPDCQGLCMECGTNLNSGTCDCINDHPDPRLSELRDLLRTQEKSEG